MADLAGDGLIPFRCHQFYPTALGTLDRSNASFVIVLEKVEPGASSDELRRSFLMPLG
jgi:hypothetical protein